MVETLLDVWGTDEKEEFVINIIQMMHGTFNIHKWHGEQKIREIWKYVQDDDVSNQKVKRQQSQFCQGDGLLERVQTALKSTYQPELKFIAQSTAQIQMAAPEERLHIALSSLLRKTNNQ